MVPRAVDGFVELLASGEVVELGRQALDVAIPGRNALKEIRRQDAAFGADRCKQVLVCGLHIRDLLCALVREIDVHTQDVGGQLRFDTVRHTTPVNRLADPPMGIQKLLATAFGFVFEVGLHRLEIVEDAS
jgi:hypothetical protein